MRKPTLDDVAALAGVGRTTVSRVLNDGPNASKKVREKVEQAVKLLGYEVNLQARFLAGGGGRQVVLVHTSDLDTEPNSYYHAGLELGALRACSEKGYQLLTPTVMPALETYRTTLVDMIQSGRCDILILTPPLSDDLELIACTQELGCRVVAISPGQEVRGSVAGVGLDDELAGYDLTKYLLELGHKRIAFLQGIEGHCSAQERYDGFCRAHQELGVHIDESLVLRGDFTFRAGVEVTQTILESENLPTALMCANDDMAAGALLTAHKLGFNIPADISITGFDDAPMAGVVWPPLTTIHQPLQKIGYAAVNMGVGLLRPQNRDPDALHVVIEHHIVPRESAISP
ncbi:MAG: LacI family DNA-binding transcriptional regulator [Kordiimonadaceae bacterium]|nr:LacI family DNA-binding transcriptional regulator [Kordiimonadaceae bacterium]